MVIFPVLGKCDGVNLDRVGVTLLSGCLSGSLWNPEAYERIMVMLVNPSELVSEPVIKKVLSTLHSDGTHECSY